MSEQEFNPKAIVKLFLKRLLLYTFGLLLLMPLLQGCSTKKNTFASRAYHKVTSKYNIYFNANESFKAGQNRVETAIEDDFTRLLPVYKESDPAVSNMVKSDMDNAIIKASKLIEIHSITEKPKRRSTPDTKVSGICQSGGV
jgi:hypothetical protein